MPSHEGQPGPVHISDITLTLQKRFGKTVNRIEFKTTAGHLRGVPVAIAPGGQYKETFNPVLKLSIQEEVTITIHCSKRLFGIQTRSAKIVIVKWSEVNNEAKDDQDGRNVYFKLLKHAEVHIGLSISPQSPPSKVPETPHGSVTPGSPSPPHGITPPVPHESDSPLPVPSESANTVPSDVADHNPTTLEHSHATESPLPPPRNTASPVPHEINSPPPVPPQSARPPPSDGADPAPAPLQQSHATAESHGDTRQGDHLSPVTSDILKICPRFRLLVIGNSGVGKSTLIRKVFGVEDVNIDNERPGQADIDREFVAKDNGLFVVHDSLGLEPGDDKHLNIIKNFIKQRRAMTDMKEKLHAVWVCLPVPYAKGRLLETGMENFLRQRKEILGDIPIVIVLTKVDMLSQQLLYEVSKKGAVKSLEDALAKAEAAKPDFLETYCAKPLRAIVNDVPHVAVSVLGELVSTIPGLVKTTNYEIQHYIAGKPLSREAWSSFESLENKAPLYVAGMAQRVSIEDNVNLTINIGKRRYWNDLTATMTFPEEKVEEYLAVIHKDIIQAWNFNDPNGVLRSDEFKAALISASNLVADNPTRSGDQNGNGSPDDDNVIHTLGDVIGNLIKAAIKYPVMGATQLATLSAEVYRAPQRRVKCFVTYITDFVYVMEILFVVSQQGPITTEKLALAFEVYKGSYQKRIHFEIRDFCDNYRKPDPNTAMEQIERMIRRFPITDDDVAKLRKKIEENKKMTPSD